ncbi:MAG: hypothetical protein N2513_01650 [Deltaproteobacteria bacterium]|nr:hypothetical protein [Deltaproteobacteria bacterium]
MKESYDIPLISSVIEPLEKLRISGGYGGLQRRSKKKAKEPKGFSQDEVEEKKENEELEKERLIDITI